MDTAPSAEVVARLLAQRDWLHALARSIAGAREAEDLVQDAWVAALERPPGRPDALRPWLASVVRNLAHGVRRTRGRRGERERRAARREALPSTGELVERVDTEQRLARALLVLDEPYRTTLLLRFHEGLTSAEIARRQGVPEGTVRWRCKAGLDELRGRLERELGGREALGVALAGVMQSAGEASGAAGAATGTASAAGAPAFVGSKTIVAAVAACAAGLVAWLALAQPSVPLANGRTTEVVLEGSIAGAAAQEQSGEVVVPSASSTGRTSGAATSMTSQPVSAKVELTRLHVLGSDGRPHALRSVLIEPLPNETGLLSGWLDEKGWIDFPASGERRRIAIERFDAFPFRAELELVPGEQEIVLTEPQGEVLAGIVLVDGAEPEGPLWLKLYAASYADDMSLPRCLLADVANGSTDPRGRFCFRGLEPGRGYNLRAPGGHVRPGTRDFTDPDNGAVFFFEGPATGVRIELERHARVRGRVLEADGVTPVAHATIELAVAGSRRDGHADANGAFEFFVKEPPGDVRVRLMRNSDPGDLLTPEENLAGFEFHFPEPRLVTDLGAILLTPGAGFYLDVRDPEGRPLAGAEAGIATDRPTGVTDASGRVWMARLAPGTELAVTLRRYGTAFVPLPDPILETVRVVLAPSNDLTLELRGPDGELLDDTMLELAAAEWFLATAEPSSEAWRGHSRNGGEPGSWWLFWPRNEQHDGERVEARRGPPVRLLLNTGTEGRVSLGELRPGFALHLSVIDDTGLVLHEQEIAPLRPAERRVVSVHLDAAPRELSGRVVSGSGAPIPGAGVSLGAIGGEESRREGTGNDGRFHFHRVAEREFRLAVAKDGFLPLVREPVRPGAELELVLERVPDVTVRVFAASGRPFPGGTVRARHTDDEQREPYADDGVTAEPIADGLFELRVRRSKPAGCRE